MAVVQELRVDRQSYMVAMQKLGRSDSAKDVAQYLQTSGLSRLFVLHGGELVPKRSIKTGIESFIPPDEPEVVVFKYEPKHTKTVTV